MRDDVMSAEEFFGDLDENRGQSMGGFLAKKTKGDVLARAKVKMMMRIYGVSRSRALEMIAERAARKDALESMKRAGDDDLMTAEDFFGA